MISSDLRKLIKYDERMGIRCTQQDYYENLFNKTTASYRAKIDKDKTSKKITAMNDILNRIDRIGQSVVTGIQQDSSLQARLKSGAENKENQRLNSFSSNNSITEPDVARHQPSSKKILDKYYEDWRSRRTSRDVLKNGESDKTSDNVSTSKSSERNSLTKLSNEKSKLEMSPTWKERMSNSDETLHEKHHTVRTVIHDAIVQELQDQFEKTFKIDLKNKMEHKQFTKKMPTTIANDSANSDESLIMNIPSKQRKETKRPRTAPIYSSIKSGTTSLYNNGSQSVLSNFDIITIVFYIDYDDI